MNKTQPVLFQFNTHTHLAQRNTKFLISNFRRVLYVVCFLLRNSPALNFICQRFGTMFHLHRRIGMKMEQCSETSAYKIQTPGNYPEEITQ